MIKFFPVKDAPADTKMPQRATKASAGYDLYAPFDIVLRPFERSAKIKLNVKLLMPERCFMKIENRSSLRDKGIELSCGGVIDSDYFNNQKTDGNIMIRIYNNTSDVQVLNKGDAICQGIIQAYFVTDDDQATEERTGGFGSTNR